MSFVTLTINKCRLAPKGFTNVKNLLLLFSVIPLKHPRLALHMAFNDTQAHLAFGRSSDSLLVLACLTTLVVIAYLFFFFFSFMFCSSQLSTSFSTHCLFGYHCSWVVKDSVESATDLENLLQMPKAAY